MKAASLLIFLVLTIGLCSCTSDRLLIKTYRKSPDYNGIAPVVSVDGSYLNRDTNQQGHQQLSRALFACIGFRKHCIKEGMVSHIDLKYNGADLLNTTLRYNDGHQEQHRIKVKNKGGYLRLRPHFFIIPIPVLYFVEEEEKTILFTDSAGRLIAVNRHFDWGQAFLFIGGSHDDRRITVAAPVAGSVLVK